MVRKRARDPGRPAPGGALSDLVDGSRPGAVYLFNRHAGGFNQWRQQAWFSSSDGGSGDRFGTSIAANGTRVLVGASYASIDLSRNGAAYLYEVEPALTGQRFLPLTRQ